MGLCMSKKTYTLDDGGDHESDVKPIRKTFGPLETLQFLFELLVQQGGVKELNIFQTCAHQAELGNAEKMLLNMELEGIGLYENPHITAGVIKRQLEEVQLVLDEGFYALDAKDDIGVVTFWQSLTGDERILLKFILNKLKDYANNETRLNFKQLATILVTNILQRAPFETRELMLARIEKEIRFFTTLLEADATKN